MALIFGASADTHSAVHTSRIFVPILHWLFPGLPEARIDELHYYVRKLGHFSEYAILGALYWRVIRSDPRLTGSRGMAGQFLLVVLLCCLFAASDEFHQLFVPTREGKVTDVLIDTFGSSAGALVYWGFLRCFCKK
jgi:VanZ family protein